MGSTISFQNKTVTYFWQPNDLAHAARKSVNYLRSTPYPCKGHLSARTQNKGNAYLLASIMVPWIQQLISYEIGMIMMLVNLEYVVTNPKSANQTLLVTKVSSRRFKFRYQLALLLILILYQMSFGKQSGHCC